MGELVEEVDMVSLAGCSDNPLVRLIELLKNGAPRVRVKARKSVLPPQLAELLAEKYSYTFTVKSSTGETYEGEFSKK